MFQTTTKTLRVLIQWAKFNRRISIHQGGSRSGKTWGILMYIVYWCFKLRNQNKIVTICRQYSATLDDTVLYDFLEILKMLDIFNEKDFRKSKKQYILFGNTVRFVGLDKSQKLRGRKSNLLYINEANECSWESFTQLDLRTTGRIIIDFNPSDEFWLKDVQKKYVTDCEPVHITTFRDNPFLEKWIVNGILALKNVSEHLWLIFGEGKFGLKEGIVFPTWAQVFTPFPKDCKKIGFGMDFGYTNDPTTLVLCGIWQGELHLKELVYEKGLRSGEIISELKRLRISRTVEIRADSADPRLIDEICDGGFNVLATEKFSGSILEGIRILHKFKVVVHDSPNLWKERNLYSWKKSGGQSINMPIDKHNHLMDAIRYYALANLNENGGMASVEKQKM
jgi:phage terminase large subunit